MLTLKAPAKINLTLEILSKREDGFHTLRSVMVPIGLYDEILLEPAEPGQFRSSDAALLEDNLVSRALAAAGVEKSYAVTLSKGIPVGGGLGGGSSDAAAILQAAIDGRLPAKPRDWLAVARALGSDVPFFLSGTGALVEGTGERLTPIGRLPPWWAVVVQPTVPVSTAGAYRLLDEARRHNERPTLPRSDSRSLDAVDALQRADFSALQRLLSNDFQTLVLDAFPEVRAAFDTLERAGAGGALLSGSGSCLFAIFEYEDAARQVFDRLDRVAFADAFVAPFVSAGAWR